MAFCVIFFGYIAQSSLLQYVFYTRSGKTGSNTWKIQDQKTDSVGQFWGPPLLSSKPNRAKDHGILATCNLLIAGAFAAMTTECSVRGWNRMCFDRVGVSALLGELLLAVAFQSVAVYYWHRLMHTKPFYAQFHKLHHVYKSPEVWDDMYIHPLEATGYYCILYAPPFLFPTHRSAFLAYMGVMGICGVLDHSGVRACIPGLYNTADHDNHHLKFEVNYSFPFPYMDLLHGTFDGEFLGRRYCYRKE
ncbi:fatty acid hydroxylase superfamily-domain-containing protein [Ochromonadaceae sp. CCMP2298]|nr:fatty acid hydroxylase superfamily-domain-containing protein [Ochromonadaceae sp. CCMP2298]